MSLAAKYCLLGMLVAICGGGLAWQYELERRRESMSAPGELYGVVLKQVSAFRLDDYAGAYQEASTDFQQKFDIEAFEDLARTEYPGLLHAARVEFGAVHGQGRHAVIPAYFFLHDGDVIPCVYSLVREEDAWKIDGVRVLRRLPPGQRLSGTRL